MCRFRKIGILFVITVTLFISLSCTPGKKDKLVEIDVLVIPSRNHTRMQPEIFYSFMDTAKKIKPLLEMEFVLFNPFQNKIVEEGVKFQKELKKFMDLLNECLPEVIAIKKAEPTADNLLYNIHEYIRTNPDSHLTRLHAKIENIIRDFEFLIIESSDTYGVHPIFTNPTLPQSTHRKVQMRRTL